MRDAAVQQLLDKQAINEVVLRYCRGIDRLVVVQFDRVDLTLF